jgi:hypothetical protein
MSTAERHRSPVYRQLEAYEESWKRDHQQAMGCRDWEDAIAVGSNIFQMLREREQVWRHQVFRGVLPYSEDDDLDHQGRFANWLDTTREVLAALLPQLEKRFGTVEGASNLRECAELAEKIVLGWQPPRLSMAVGLREMTLSSEAAAELDRILEEARRNPPPRIESRMEVKDASFLKRPAPSKNPS